MSVQKPQLPGPLQNNSVEARIIKQKIWNRLWVDNEHFMGAIVGREGSGKSKTGLKICKSADPSFHAGRALFEPQAFLERLQEWKEDNKTQGKMVLADEAGVGVGVRTWYDKDQIIFNQVLQVIRDENMGILFTLPRLNELDSQTRGRLHAVLEMGEKEPGQWAKVKWLNWRPTRDERDETYRSYPKLRINGHKRKVKRLTIAPPDPELAQAYDERKEEFQKELYQQAINQMDDQETDDEKSVKEVAMEIANDNMKQFVSTHNQTNEPYINKQLIRAEYEISHSDADAVKSLLERQFSKKELEHYV